MLIESLDDPVTARVLARKLALPTFPIQGSNPDTPVTTPALLLGYLPRCSSAPDVIDDSIVFEDTANSRIGIGRNDPTQKLDVNGNIQVSGGDRKVSLGSVSATNIGLYFHTISDQNYYIGRDGTAWGAGQPLIAASYYGWQFKTGGLNRMLIDSAGKVGIGTTPTGEKLEVGDSSGARVSFNNAGGVTRKALLFQGPGTYCRILGYDYGGATGLNLILQDTGGGKVGIATTAPAVKLDARGANAKSAEAAFENIFQVASTDSSDPLALRAGIKTDSTAGDRYGAIEVGEGSTARSLALQPSGGNVGIGRTDPQARLHVKSGGITIEDDMGAGRLGFAQTGESDARIVLYRGGTPCGPQDEGTPDITILRNFPQAADDCAVWTLLRVWAPRIPSGTPDREATISLVRDLNSTDDDSQEFIDLYNNGYVTAGDPYGTQYGIRSLKRKGSTGQFRDFVFDQWETDPPNRVELPAIMVLKKTRKVGIGIRDNLTARLSIRSDFTAKGTVSVSVSSSTVTGTNTLFSVEIDVGDKIKIDSTGEIKTVTAIASPPNQDTSLTVDSAFTSAASGSTMTVMNNLLRLDDSSGTTKVFITEQGNVGVGTTAPNEPLHIKESVDSDANLGQLLLQNEGAGHNNAGMSFQVTAAAETTGEVPKAGIIFERSQANGRGTLHFINDIVNDLNPWTLGTDTKIAINHLGNVGVGTAAPNEPLEVASQYARAIISDGAGANRRGLLLIGPTASADYGQLRAYGYGTSGQDKNIVICPVAGKVGIGTITPLEKLTVAAGEIGLDEMSPEPGAPGANRARLYVRDNGGKTQLVVRFSTGPVQVLATEP